MLTLDTIKHNSVNSHFPFDFVVILSLNKCLLLSVRTQPNKKTILANHKTKQKQGVG